MGTELLLDEPHKAGFVVGIFCIKIRGPVHPRILIKIGQSVGNCLLIHGFSHLIVAQDPRIGVICPGHFHSVFPDPGKELPFGVINEDRCPLQAEIPLQRVQQPYTEKFPGGNLPLRHLRHEPRRLFIVVSHSTPGLLFSTGIVICILLRLCFQINERSTCYHEKRCLNLLPIIRQKADIFYFPYALS